MGHLEGNFTPVLYIQRKVPKGQRSCATIFNKTSNFKVAITEMYPRIPWELVADPFEPAEHSLGRFLENKHKYKQAYAFEL